MVCTLYVTRDDLTLKGIVSFPQSQKYPRVKYIIRIAGNRGFTAQKRLGSTIFGGAKNFRAENTIQTRIEPHLLTTEHGIGRLKDFSWQAARIIS